MVWAKRNSKKVVILVGHIVERNMWSRPKKKKKRNMWWFDQLVGPIGEVKKDYSLAWHFMTNALGEC